MLLDEIIYRHNLLAPYSDTSGKPELSRQPVEIITGEMGDPRNFRHHTVSLSDAGELLSTLEGRYIRAYGANAYAFEVDAILARHNE